MVLTKEALHDFVLESFVAFTESITTKRHSIAEFHRTGLQSIFYSQRSWRMKYPCTDCKDIMDDILEKHTNKTSGTIGWKNNRGSILPTDHAWVVAKVFMPHGCEKNMNTEDTDAAALFKMLFTCRLFDSIDITDREKMVRTRNALMHASDFKVDVKDMEVFFEFMINVLENEKSGLKTRKECQRTVSDLQKLKGLHFYDTQPWKSYNMARSALQISQAELTNEIEALEADTNQKDTKALKDSLRICTTELKLLSEPTAVFLGHEVMELRSTLCKKEKIITEQSVSLENTQREMQRTQKKENDSNNLLSSFNVDLQKYKDDLSRAKARNASLERNVQALEKEKETILSEKEELRQSLGAVIQDMQRQYESQDDGTKTDKKGVPETSREHRNMIDELKQHLDEFKVKR